MRTCKFFIAALMLCMSVGTMAQTQVRFYTTMGEFVVEMSDSLTPITSGNFIDLVEEGYYDGVIFHRVMDGFMIQGGDPSGTGSGGPGYTIQDEFDSTGTLSNVQRTISMANTGQPNSGGSQFFINLVNNTYLDFDKPPYTSKHPVFGMVVDSFEVVQAIGSVAVDAQNRPITDVVMDSLRVIRPDTLDTSQTEPEGIGRFSSEHKLQLKVFPNPVGLESVISINAPESGQARIRILDGLGRPVIETDRVLRQGVSRISGLLETQNALPPGIYTLSVHSGASSANTRLAVTR